MLRVAVLTRDLTKKGEIENCFLNDERMVSRKTCSLTDLHSRYSVAALGEAAAGDRIEELAEMPGFVEAMIVAYRWVDNWACKRIVCPSWNIVCKASLPRTSNAVQRRSHTLAILCCVE